jgi:phospholipid/cholesterol/gamma-HCH transport system substrate-binding protein
MSKAFRLGAFIITALLIFAGAIFWIGSKQFLFRSTYVLNADFENVAGLTDGAEVRVSGMHEGTVKRKELPQRPDGKVRVVMNLKSVTREVIKKDSVAAIKSEGLVGDKYVEISFGSNESPKVNDGDTIQTEPPLEIADLVKKTNVILDSAKGAMDRFGETAGNLQSISSKINRGAGTMGALVNDRSIYEHANAGAAAFKEDMEALKHNFLLRGFFKKRGYEDSSDLRKDEIEKLPAKPLVQKFTYEAKKIFERTDTAKLTNQKALNDAGKFLETTPFGLAVVAASTDMRGDTEEDRTLTQARAMVVRDCLVHNFKLDDTRIKTIGLGKSSDATEPSKVEILVYPVGTDRAVAQNKKEQK